MRMRKPVRPLPLMWLLSLILFLLAISGVGGGILLLQDPTGAVMGLNATWLASTPMHDFAPAGLVLLIVFGIGSLGLLYALWEMPKSPFLTQITRFTHAYWAWDFTILLGIVLLVWVLAQLVLLPVVAPVQPVMIVVALSLIVLPLLPDMRRYYAR